MGTMKSIIMIVMVLVIINYCNGDIQNPINSPDLPGFSANLKIIPAGSLIIPMDPSLQVLDPKTKLMSVLPYGLVIRSLWQNISVSWAIQSGKVFNGADLSAVTLRSNFLNVSTSNSLASSTSWAGWSSPSSTTYYGGPFIILQQNVARALQVWSNFKLFSSNYFITVDPSVYDSVNIHILTTSVVVDIRHTISTRPFVAVSNLNGNAPTQTAIMGCIYQNANRSCKRENGYGWGDLFGFGTPGCKAFEPQDHAGLEFNIHYATYDCGSQVQALTSNSCLTAFSEPHWEWVASKGPSYISAMKDFVYSGANFIAQCSSVQSYENSAANVAGTGTFLSNFGTMPYNPVSGVNYEDWRSQNTITNYPDLPVCQFVNPMSSAPTGNVPDFYNLFGQNDTVPLDWNATEVAPLSEQSYNDFNGKGFPLVTNIYDTRTDGVAQGRSLFVAAGAKYNYNQPLGSNVFYLGGHSWAGVTSIGAENGRRFLFNAFITPTARPASCGFTFCIPNEACDGFNSCTKCRCDPSGSGFIYENITNCCVSDKNCTSPCTRCNSNTHTCELIAGCCSTNPVFNLTCGDCEACVNVTDSVNGGGVCKGLDDCCVTDDNCTSISSCVHCVNSSCVRTPAPLCCDSDLDCTGTCTTCDLNLNTCVRLPFNECCTTSSDCGANTNNPCLACNAKSNQCYTIPGCCNNASDCGSNPGPCVTCTNNACKRTAGCCEDSSQCGTCLQCDNVTNTCLTSSDENCCVKDEDCGNCRRCAVGLGGAKTCLLITDCCLSSADCELCQNCSSTHQCVPIDDCCLYDTDCDGCDQCQEFHCVKDHSLDCCFNDTDCYIARDYLRNSTNASSIPDCDLVCEFDSYRNNKTGRCQSICVVPKNWTGLIVGLAVGVPVGLLFLLAIAAGLILFLLWKKDAVSGAILTKGADLGINAMVNPAFVSPVTVGHSAL